MGRWQEIEHTADLALHLWANDLPDLFATAARGMFTFIAADDGAAPTRAIPVTLEALDVETLLIDWLNELLYWTEIEGLIFTAFEFERLTPTHLTATAYGKPITEYGKYVKAATFHDLAVRATPEGYETEIVFDT
ncbi:MAG TPA: archease [Anaerolineae bacterium]|nr:archease [Anaerolineae bacterium]HQI86990.1 archease [Anaerolineae bacterium]